MIRALTLALLPVLLAAQQPGRSGTVGPPMRLGRGLQGPAAQRGGAAQEAPQFNPEDAGTISGLVSNGATGEPLARATVTLIRAMGPNYANAQRALSATTDASGNFVITGVPPGAYALSARRTGFVNGIPTSVTGGLVRLGAKERLGDIRIAMTPHAVITGRVTAADDGGPIEHVQVQAMRYRYFPGGKQLTPYGNASTNDLGEYRLTGLAPGRYYVAASPQRMAGLLAPQTDEDFIATYYPDTPDPAAAAAVSVASGEQLGNINLRLPKRRTVGVKGRVSPVPEQGGRQRLVVFLRSRGGITMNRSAVVSPEGDFEFRGVPPGSYLLGATFFQRGVPGLAARLPLEVGEAPVENVSLVMSPPMNISGTVRAGGETAPAGNLRIALRPEMPFGGGPLSAAAGENGSFELTGVAPGQYGISVTGLPEGTYLKSVTAGGREVLAAGLDLSAGAAGPIAIVLGANAGQVSGTVQNSRQEGVSGINVALVPQEEERRSGAHYYRSARSGDAGAFSFNNLAPGSYKLYAWSQVEPNAWFDRDFLRQFENAGESVAIREGSREDVKVRLIE